MAETENPLPPPEFFAELAGSLPAGGFTRDPAELRVWGGDWSGMLEPRPCAVAFPRSTADVSRVLALCTSHGVPVVPSGGRTGLSGGAVAASGELVLSLTRMNALGPVDARAQTLRAQAGAITQAVHEHCAPLGLTWPVDFASKGSSTVGGNIATNAGGVRVIRYGNTRHWVLGLTAVTMSGEVLELGGALEKDNTGFDLRGLLIGSEGALAVVTEATLRLARLPAATSVCFFALRDFRRVLELFDEARRGPFTLSAFECLDRASLEAVLAARGARRPVGEGGAYVLVEAEGEIPESWLERASALAEDAAMALSPREASELWSLREGVAEAIFSAKREVHQHDVSVGIADLEAFAGEIAERYRRAYPDLEVFIFGHIGDGNLHVFLRRPEALTRERFLAEIGRSDADLFESVRKYRGSVSAEHGVGLLKKPALPYSRSALEISLMRGIKRVFDPRGLLNPGKVVD